MPFTRSQHASLTRLMWERRFAIDFVLSPSVLLNNLAFSFPGKRACRPWDMFWVAGQGLLVAWTCLAVTRQDVAFVLSCYGTGAMISAGVSHLSTVLRKGYCTFPKPYFRTDARGK